MSDQRNNPKANPQSDLWLAALGTQPQADRELMAAKVKLLLWPNIWTGCNRAKWGMLADPRGEYDCLLPWTVVACVGSEVVGSASLVRRAHDDVDYGPWLAGLVVRPDFQELDICSLLIAEVERHSAHLHRHGHPDLLEGKIYLDTERTINAFDSVSMYARRGWTFLSSEYEHRQDGIVMSKSVKD